MATLSVTEHTRAGRDGDGTSLPIYGPYEKSTRQKVTIAGSRATTTTVFKSDTTFVRLVTDTACQFEICTSPTADGDSEFLPSGASIDIEVSKGQKVAVISQQ